MKIILIKTQNKNSLLEMSHPLAEWSGPVSAASVFCLLWNPGPTVRCLAPGMWPCDWTGVVEWREMVLDNATAFSPRHSEQAGPPEKSLLPATLLSQKAWIPVCIQELIYFVSRKWAVWYLCWQTNLLRCFQHTGSESEPYCCKCKGQVWGLCSATPEWWNWRPGRKQGWARWNTK